MKEVKVFLKEKDMPRKWYNLAADLSGGIEPPLAPDGKPISPDMLSRIFPMNLIEQEASVKRWIDIPEEVISILLRWRPAPLRRAVYLEEYLKTPARIYYKDESLSPAGSHKPNTAVVQAWYNKKFGIKKITTETGAGQWGSALAFACNILKLECKVYMVRISFDQKPMRKLMMQVWGARCIASPSKETKAGRDILKKMPNTPGSLGIAISEAIEEAVSDKSGKTRYSLGSVLNHVLLHQTIIGLEAKKQLRLAGEKKPDVIIGCVGGGSNFAGLAFPFVYDKIHGEKIEIIPVEPTACPTLTRGPFAYDYGDTAGMTPLLPMFTLGHNFIPEPIHAGGLRYHGMAPLISHAIMDGLFKPKAYDQVKCYNSAFIWAKTEGTVPAPETSHAIACAIDEALKAKREKKRKVILFNYSGHGLMDLAGYEKFLSGKLAKYHLPEEDLKASLEAIKRFPKVRRQKEEKLVSRVLKITLFLFLFIIQPFIIYADLIKLKNGRSIEGIIYKEDAHFVELEVSVGTIKLPKDQVAEILPSGEDEGLSLRKQWEKKRVDFENKLNKQKAIEEAKPRDVKFSHDSKGIVLKVAINDKIEVPMLLDTGASVMLLTRSTAKRAGIDLSRLKPDLKVQVADGRVVDAARVVLKSVVVENFKMKDMTAAVLMQERGDFDFAGGLLGMSFLKNFNFKIDHKEKRLILEKI